MRSRTALHPQPMAHACTALHFAVHLQCIASPSHGAPVHCIVSSPWRMQALLATHSSQTCGLWPRLPAADTSVTHCCYLTQQLRTATATTALLNPLTEAPSVPHTQLLPHAQLLPHMASTRTTAMRPD